MININPQRLQAYLAHIQKTRHEQPTRLLEARAQAAAARKTCLTNESEHWDATLNVVPTVDHAGQMNGLLVTPCAEATQLWATRLAFDLLGCTPDETHIEDTFNEYRKEIRQLEHQAAVFEAALKVISEHVVPDLLNFIERHASDFGIRVSLAEAATNAWATAREREQ